MNRYLSLLILIPFLTASSAGAEELTLAETVKAQQRLIKRRPGNARLHNDLGNLLLLVGKKEEAEAAYRQALTLQPELVSAHFNLGLLYQQTGRDSKAGREFKAAVKLDPEHAWAHYQLGVLNARDGRRNAAIKSYARALRLDPRLTDPAYNPHILDNHLAPSATLEAYADMSSADLVPRTYQSPRRIAGLLVPMLPSDDAEAVEQQPASAPATDEAADGFEDEPGGPAEVKPADEQPVKKKRPRRKNRRKKQRPAKG